jgi:predicted ferric reductase
VRSAPARWTVRGAVSWAAACAAIAVPLGLAALSPQLQWRHAVYMAAGFAGIAAFGLLLIQPLLIAGLLPTASPMAARRLHRWCGALVVVAIVAHVGLLWLTSAPDVMDALLFQSPTSFSVWGVTAMWAAFATAVVAIVRRRARLSPRVWRRLHLALAVVIAGGTIVHALLIEGTMETISKVALCVLVATATLWTMVRAR